MKKKIWAAIKKYFWNIALGLDQLANVVLGGLPDETLSARAWRKALAGQWFWRVMVWIIDHIFFWQDDHCQASYDSEKAGNHSPKEFAHE